MVVLRPGPPRGGIYCCVPHIGDPDQISVDDQERLGRERAAALGIKVSARSVFIDTQRSVWKPGGACPRWSALLVAVKRGEFESLLLYGPGSLFRRRAADAVRLLELCDERGVELHGLGDSWNLSDATHRRQLLDQAARSMDTAVGSSRAARSAHEKAAAAGRPHGGGRRAYGYEPGMSAQVPTEAAIVEEVFSRFLSGATLRAIAWDLNDRNVPTVGAGQWTTTGIARLLDAPRYAGLRVFRGQIAELDGGYQQGAWQPCVSVEDWERARSMRAARALEASSTARDQRYYPLTGLAVCANCGHHMVGARVGAYPMYACASENRSVKGRCTRRIGAASLEAFVEEAALRILESWDTSAVAGLPMASRRNADPPSAETQTFRRSHGAVVVRSVEALDGVDTGDAARQSWHGLSSTHRAAILRFLFASIGIGSRTVSGGVFDESRIDLVRNVL